MIKPKKVHGWRPQSGLKGINGLSASPGLSVGSVFLLQSGKVAVEDAPQDLAKDAELLENALERTKDKMKAIVDDVTRRIGASDAARASRSPASAFTR